ncbi:hypothetical protein CAN33_0052710 [Aspergillus niger]|uniref:Uncharacterized protein n=1 Tax=Aspergillus niger TaxID=5061 RepID=A0A505I8K6_ASPNG|nr:hypothetical protein CAN33_0052710 [Aspergillus niger]
MRLQLTTSLALLATASTVVADDVVSVLWPSSASGENYNAKLIGTTGGDLTTLRATTASSSDDDDDNFNDSCNVPDSGETLTVGSSTWAFTTSGTAFSEEAACAFTGTTVASCAFTFNIDTQTSSSSGVTTTQLNKWVAGGAAMMVALAMA